MIRDYNHTTAYELFIKTEHGICISKDHIDFQNYTVHWGKKKKSLEE